MKPFKYGCVVTKEAFCRRPQLQSRLVEYVRDGQNVALVGERRMGKTSLIYSVHSELREYRMLYVDFLNIRTVGDFCNRVATAAAQMGTKESFVSRTIRFMSRLRPTLSLNPDNGMPVVSVDSRMAEDPCSMGDVVSLIEHFASEERMFVVFDEFQEVKKLPDYEQLLAVLRSKIQLLENTCFVYCGSVREDMVSIFSDPASPFFKSALTLEVASISDEDFVPFLISRFAAGHRRADRALIDSILELTRRTTGDVQQLCAAIWSVTEEDAVLTSDDIKAGMMEVLAVEGGQFEYQTATLTRYQMKALYALAELGGSRVFSKEFIEHVGASSASTLSKALNRLVKDRLVYLYRNEYCFFNPFFRAWLRSRGI